MAKIRTRFICQNCGYATGKWMGKCPECEMWDSLVEELVSKPAVASKSFLAPGSRPKSLANIEMTNFERIATGIGEFDKVLGGGIVPGSLILLGGDPGIGKSTLALDASIKSSKKNRKVLYVSGEESEAQTKMRANRIGTANDNLLVMTETDLANVLEQAEQINPELLVIDSIQTMYSSDIMSSVGSVGQIKECTAKLLRLAKSTGIAILIIGHVTKDGNIAGPRLLEHMVDVVLHFEGERSYSFRVLRALKNRFGSTGEAGIFTMGETGLLEVNNPAGLFLDNREEAVTGAVITACLEGNQPMLLEIQALVATTPYGMPRRTSVGFDYNRVTMLIAILEKRQGFELGMQDVYVNVVGGLKINEPAVDLAVIVAIVSSFRNVQISQHTLVLGEVGLTGEIRRVNQLAKRVKEAQALGFEKFIVPKANEADIAKIKGVILVKTLDEALQEVFY